MRGWPCEKPAATADAVPNWKMSLGIEATILVFNFWFVFPSSIFGEFKGVILMNPGVEESRILMSVVSPVLAIQCDENQVGCRCGSL